jgi:hypothetical protein
MTRFRGKPELVARYRLALALGFASPTVMLDSMTGLEWRAWQHYMRREPFGWTATNIHQAAVRSALAAGKKKRTLDELLLRTSSDEQRPGERWISSEAAQAYTLSVAAVTGGASGIKVVTRGNGS